MRAGRIPKYGEARIPAYHMIRFSVAIQRGCFGGCTFCSITEHEGRIIQSRSEDSVIREIETIRDHRAGVHRCRLGSGRPDGEHVSPALQERRHRIRLPAPLLRLPGHLPELEHRPCAAHPICTAAPVRCKGVKKVLIASGVRYDLAVESPEYVKELATHHTGGYLKIAPEAIGGGPALEDDEAGRRRLLQVQGAVRPLLEGGGQGAVSHSVFHRRASRHARQRTCSSSRCG